MKKSSMGIVIGIVVLLLALGGGGFFAYTKLSGPKATPKPTAKPKLSLPVNVIPVSERPYVMLEPTTAREVMMTIGELKKKSDSVDFELQYSAGDKEEAAIGAVDFMSSQKTHTKKVLLGSQSGGGKITYHENVTGGSLVLTFYDENYKLSNEWSYVDNKKPSDGFSSRDAKFQITTGKLLNNSPYVIVYNNPGLPAEVKGELLGGPYSVGTTGELPAGKVDVSLRLVEEKTAELWGWDGKTWKKLGGKMDGKTLTATGVDLMVTYVAVGK